MSDNLIRNYAEANNLDNNPQSNFANTILENDIAIDENQLTESMNEMMLEEFKENILVKVRSTGKLLKAKVNFKNDETASVGLEEFEDGISPGQACVFYKRDIHGEKLLGGGWITL